MKKDIHPAYFPKATITCACGKIYTLGSTKEKMEVEICAACHPLYTGNEKVLDSAGRVERFKARQSGSKKVTSKKVATKAKSSEDKK